MAKVDLFWFILIKKLRMQKVDDLANTLSPFHLTWSFYFGRFFIECRIVCSAHDRGPRTRHSNTLPCFIVIFLPSNFLTVVAYK